MADAPDALTTFPVFLSVPPQPPFPRELHGRPVLAVGAAYAGSIDEGLRVVEPLRRLGRRALDLLGPMPYLALQTMIDESLPQRLHYYNRSEYLDELSDDAIETLVSQFARAPSPLAQVITGRMGSRARRGDAAVRVRRRLRERSPTTSRSTASAPRTARIGIDSSSSSDTGIRRTSSG